MRSDVVDAWLRHWLKIQKKNKHPLVLINQLDRASDKQANLTTLSKEKQRKGKGRDVDGDDSSNEDITDDDIVDGEGGRSNADAPGTRPNHTEKSSGGMANGEVVPQSPNSVSDMHTDHSAFLATLSNNRKYKDLLLLLHAAKVSNTLSI
jgi:hypothetical protein